MKYNITTPRGSYQLEAEDHDNLRLAILERENITFVPVVESFPRPNNQGGFVYLRQGDPRWARIMLGNTQNTLARYGCLITSLSMLSYWAGDFHRPDELAKQLKFTPEGYYIWTSGDAVLPFVFLWRHYNGNIDKIKEILYSIDRVCVARVSFAGAYHWLAVIGIDAITGAIIGADPLTGTRVFIENKYGKINGFSELKLKK